MDYNSINIFLSFPNSIKTKCRLRSTVDLFYLVLLWMRTKFSLTLKIIIVFFI